MPDGKRRRRFSANRAKRAWYCYYRGVRFDRRFGLVEPPTIEFFVVFLEKGISR